MVKRAPGGGTSADMRYVGTLKARAGVTFDRLLVYGTGGLAYGSIKASDGLLSKTRGKTGYVVGGISPLGQRKKLPTVLDSSALEWDRVLCSAGKRGLDIALAPRDLIELTAATVAEIRAEA